jgi:ERCC4-type nuclease
LWFVPNEKKSRNINTKVWINTVQSTHFSICHTQQQQATSYIFVQILKKINEKIAPHLKKHLIFCPQSQIGTLKTSQVPVAGLEVFCKQ